MTIGSHCHHEPLSTIGTCGCITVVIISISDDEDLYLPLDDDVDSYLLAYLRVCKFYVESAFKRVREFLIIINYYGVIF